MRIDSKQPQLPGMSEAESKALWQAAKGMEANFMRELMRHMRNTVPENEDDANNRGLQIFRGMLDDEYADRATNIQGIGIAELIVKQMTDEVAQSQRSVKIRDLSATDYVKNYGNNSLKKDSP